MATERTRSIEQAMRGTLPVFLWESINDPGAYVDLKAGTLHRFPSDALAPGHSPIVKVEGNNVGPFAKVSDDPEVPTVTARLICKTYNLQTNF